MVALHYPQVRIANKAGVVQSAALNCHSAPSWILQAHVPPSGADSIEELKLALQFG